MVLTSTVGRTAQIGIARQPAGYGTPVVPTATSANTTFVKFLSGSDVSTKSTVKREFEGDGGRGQSLQTKTAQWGMAKIIGYIRPNDLAFFLAAWAGSGSDTLGTVAGGNTPHTIVPASTAGNDYYTICQNLGSGYYRQVSDAICVKLVITATKEDAWLKIDSDWLGTTTLQSGTLTSAQFQPNMPFLYYGVTHVNPAPNLNAALQGITITLDAPVTMTDFQTEGVIGNALKAGNSIVTFDMSVLFQDGTPAGWAYYGGLAGLTDAVLLPMGGLSVQFGAQDDATQTALLSMPNATFDETSHQPDPSGKPVIQKITGGSIRTLASPAFSAVVTCLGASKYSS